MNLNKRLEKGEKLYNSFCKNYAFVRVSTPTTRTLETLALLDEKKEIELLVREMMKEFISNINDIEIYPDNGILYFKSIIGKKF